MSLCKYQPHPFLIPASTFQLPAVFSSVVACVDEKHPHAASSFDSRVSVASFGDKFQTLELHLFWDAGVRHIPSTNHPPSSTCDNLLSDSSGSISMGGNTLLTAAADQMATTLVDVVAQLTDHTTQFTTLKPLIPFAKKLDGLQRKSSRYIPLPSRPPSKSMH